VTGIICIGALAFSLSALALSGRLLASVPSIAHGFALVLVVVVDYEARALVVPELDLHELARQPIRTSCESRVQGGKMVLGDPPVGSVAVAVSESGDPQPGGLGTRVEQLGMQGRHVIETHPRHAARSSLS
jgi:hypothetical protein